MEIMLFEVEGFVDCGFVTRIIKKKKQKKKKT